MKLKQLLSAALLLCSAGAWAQTDVTSTYLTNADFSQSTAIVSNLKGYGKDGTPYGFQAVDGWGFVVTAGDNSNNSYPNSGMGGAVFAYGSSYQLQGNNKAAPATNPNGEASGNCLGFFAVWSCGGYYYQDVTLPAGKYTITVPMYSQSGTQANTTYTGFFPTSGTNRTVAVNPTVGQWVNQAVSFTLTAETAGQIRVGYQSTGGGSGANPHLFIDGVKIEYTATVVKDVLSNALAAATTANAVLTTLTDAITTAQAVYDDENATQEQVNAAAAILNAAVELAMSDAGDVTAMFLTNAGFESCTETTGNAAAGGSAAPLDIAGGWTQVSSAAWSSSAVVAYGGSGQVNGVNAPSADNAGNGDKTLGVSVGWGGAVTYQSAAITLPAGVYTLKVYAYNNLSGVTQFTSKFGFVPTEGAATLSTKASFTYATWEEDKVTFTLNEATEGKIQVGGQAISGGSNNNAKVFFDNITIEYSSFLAGAKAAWDNAVTAAEDAKTANPNVVGSELTALNAELDKAEPTTVEGYNTATNNLTTATEALVSAATAYNALAAVNAMITAAGTLEYANAEKKPSASVTATSASDATSKATSQTTALRAYYESHALAEGVAEAVNYNSAVAEANADTNSGWTNGVGTNQGQGYTDSEGNVAPKYLDGGWAASAPCNIDMTRTVELPAGTYLLTVKARGAQDLTVYTLSIAGETLDLPHANGGSNGVFGNGWEDASVEFESDGTPLTLEVIARSEASQQWFSMNDFRLVQLEYNADAYAGDTEYTALNAAIAAAEEKTLGFNVLDYAPYNNVEVLETLAIAKGIDQDAQNLKSVITALTDYLNNAEHWHQNGEAMDIIYNGMFATVADGKNYPKGWMRTNAWGQMQSGISGDFATAYYNQPGSLQYGNQGVYSMPLEANSYYGLTFSYRSHENNSNQGVTASVLNDADEGLAPATFTGNGSTSEWKTVRAYFKSGAAGNYVLTLANNGNTWMTNVSLTYFGNVAQEGWFDEDFGVEEEFNELFYSEVTLVRDLSSMKWSTFVVPFDISNEELIDTFGPHTEVAEFSEESADPNDITIYFNKMATPAITANKPVLLKSQLSVDKNEDELQFTNKLIRVAAEPKATGTNIDFVGVYNYTDADWEYPVTVPAGDYFISQGELYESTGSTTIKPLRAYLHVKNGGGNVKMYIDGIATSISEIANGQQPIANGPIFNIAGQRMSKMQRGVNIVNGKKVLVK